MELELQESQELEVQECQVYECQEKHELELNYQQLILEGFDVEEGQEWHEVPFVLDAVLNHLLPIPESFDVPPQEVVFFSVSQREVGDLLQD